MAYMEIYIILMSMQDKPIIVQSDGSILLEVQSPEYGNARDAILPFAELIKSPEYIHTYRITPLSIWNAAAMGVASEDVQKSLEAYSRYEIPEGVLFRIRDAFSRWDAVRLTARDERTLLVEVRTPEIFSQITAKPGIKEAVLEVTGPRSFAIGRDMRGRFKHLLIKAGFPAHDLVGFDQGDPLGVDLRETTASGVPVDAIAPALAHWDSLLRDLSK